MGQAQGREEKRNEKSNKRLSISDLVQETLLVVARYAVGHSWFWESRVVGVVPHMEVWFAALFPHIRKDTQSELIIVEFPVATSPLQTFISIPPRCNRSY